MKPFVNTKWLAGMAALSWLVLASVSHADTIGGRAEYAQAAGWQATVTLAGAPAESEGRVYRYQYFPDGQVYFDPSRELYFYMYNGDWTKSPVLPRAIRERLGDFVIIEMDADDPYQFYMASMRPHPGPVESREREERVEAKGETVPTLPYHYYYYPRDQVYFNPQTGVYFYFREGRWQSSPGLPIRGREPLGDYMIIETDTKIPYSYHGQVLQMYFKQSKEQRTEQLAPLPWEAVSDGPVYRYLYYPAAFVYFDEDRRVYFYYTHEQWVEAPVLPPYLAKNLGNPVELRMSTREPYQFHAQIIETYPHPGVAVNVSKPVFQIWTGGR